MTASNPGSRAERSSGTNAHLVGALRATVESQGDAVLEPFMLTVVLRWADRRDAEAEAIAAFNGEEHTGLVPNDLRWASYREAPRPLTTSEVDHLWGNLSRSLGLPSQVGDGALHGTSGLLTESGATAWVTLLDVVVPWADALELDSIEGRRRARDEVTKLAASALARYRDDLTTPSPLARLMVELAGPTPGHRVYDPCCGTGGLLVEAADALWERGRLVSAAEWGKASRVPLFGVEVRPATHAVALVRLLLSGVAPALEIGDALEREAAGRHHDQGFDCVLVDPPMGMTVVGPDLYDFPIRSRRSESLFVQHALRSLRAGGRAVIAVPEVLLWSGGREAELREWLLKDFRLEAVIGLPRGRQAARRVPQSLVVVQRAAPAERVAFADLSVLPTSREAALKLAAAVRDGQGLVESASGREDEILRVQVERQSVRVRHVPVKDLLAQGAELRVPAPEEDALWTALEGLRGSAELAQLGSICEVVPGHPVSSRETLESGTPDGVPVIRIKDIGGPEIALGEKRIDAEAAPKIPGDRWVRRGDVLISTSGTIGKVHYVVAVNDGGSANTYFAPSKPFAVAQRGLVILRPKSQLDPRFLTAVLGSATYQGKLRATARGAVISNLPLSGLKSVTVPVPPPAVQQRVLARLADRPGDGLEALLLILEGKDVDPLTRLLREHPAIDLLTREGLPAGEELERASLDALRALRPIRNQAAHGQVDMPAELLGWLIAVGSLPIMSVRESKNGFRYEALTASHALLESAVARAEQLGGVVGKRARRLTERLRHWVGQELESAASDYEIDAYVIAADEPGHNEHTELTLDVALAGRAFLTDVEIECDDGIGGFTSVGHLDAEQSVSLQVGYDTEDLVAVAPDRHEFRGTVKVSGVRPDGLRVEHSIPFDHPFFGTCRASSHTSTHDPEWLDFGYSPYNAGGVIEDPDLFKGRRDILEAIRTHLGGGTKVILLEGNRRTGKTSILRQLQGSRHGLGSEWVIVESSFQGTVGDEKKDGIPTRGVFRMLVRDIGLACADAGSPVPLPDMEPVEEPRRFGHRFLRGLDVFLEGIEPYEALQLYVDMVIDALAPRRLLLMLDEFDKLQVGIDNGVTSPQVPENIRHLLQTRPRLSALLTGSRRLKRLREQYWSALFGFGHRIGLDPLRRDEVDALVTEPVSGRLRFRPEALELIAHLTACQPYFVQSLCARIFEFAKKAGERVVTPNVVDQCAARMVSPNEHFQALWDYCETDRRRYLLWLVHDEEDAEGVRVGGDLLAARLAQGGLNTPVDEVDEDLKFLVELELVKLELDQFNLPNYRCAIPLMRRWLVENIDPEAQRRSAEREAGSLALGLANPSPVSASHSASSLASQLPDNEE